MSTPAAWSHVGRPAGSGAQWQLLQDRPTVSLRAMYVSWDGESKTQPTSRRVCTSPSRRSVIPMPSPKQVNISSPTLWSATNSSTVSVFLLHLPPAQTAATSVPPASGNAPPQTPRRISAQLAKEIKLKYRAPVVGISIFDQTGCPVDQLNAGEIGTPPHRLLIASEEQFKVFSLPQLKPINKYKLTAHEGARIRCICFGSFNCPISPELLLSLHASSSTKSTRSHGDGDGPANISGRSAVGRKELLIGY
nr:lethal(2) giant larvae protein-like [Drosophila kikkawai]XP_017036965.1 lethal(2) giant larvae protein-like [Drosophila kikkawai]